MAGIAKSIDKRTAGELDSSNWPHRWPQIHLDQFRTIEKMNVHTLDVFNDLCVYASQYGLTHRINSDYRDYGTGAHHRGKAIDFVMFLRHPGDIDLLDQFFMASRFDWHGIGLYPYWNAPGLHCDTWLRPTGHRAYWWYDSGKKERSIDDITEVLRWEL